MNTNEFAKATLLVDTVLKNIVKSKKHVVLLMMPGIAVALSVWLSHLSKAISL